MTDTPKLSLQEGLRIREAVIKAILEAGHRKLPCPVAPEIGNALTALWVANRTVDYLNEHLPPVAPSAEVEAVLSAPQALEPDCDYGAVGAGKYRALNELRSRQLGHLPLRPSLDPEILGEQLRQSMVLDSPPAEMKRYKGYLAQIVANCVKSVKSGDTNAPRYWLGIMAPALHQVERIQNVEPEVALEVWMTQWFMEVSMEALEAAPRKPEAQLRGPVYIATQEGTHLSMTMMVGHKIVIHESAYLKVGQTIAKPLGAVILLQVAAMRI